MQATVPVKPVATRCEDGSPDTPVSRRTNPICAKVREPETPSDPPADARRPTVEGARTASIHVATHTASHSHATRRTDVGGDVDANPRSPCRHGAASVAKTKCSGRGARLEMARCVTCWTSEAGNDTGRTRRPVGCGTKRPPVVAAGVLPPGISDPLPRAARRSRPEPAAR